MRSYQLLLLVSSFLLSTVAPTVQQAVTIDIHIPVTGAALAQARGANRYINKLLGDAGGEVDLSTRHKAHVTLYLTAWTCEASTLGFANMCPARVAASVAGVLMHMVATPPCVFHVQPPFVTGQYAMMDVDVTPCLQLWSDSIVNVSYHLAEPDQPVPDWVNTLPEKERNEKIRLNRLFGSPNVFSQFKAHVTIGWAANTSLLAAAVAKLSQTALGRPTAFTGQMVALGAVGLHGTVLVNQDFASFNITSRSRALRIRKNLKS
jgi:hypothetical protein